MKRPFCVIGFTLLFTCFVASFITETAMSVVFFAALVAFCLSLTIKRIRKDGTIPTAMLCVLLALCLLGVKHAEIEHRQKAFCDKKIIVSGSLSDLPSTRGGKQYAVLRTDMVDGKPLHMKVYLSSSETLDLKPCDRFTGTVRLYALGDNVKNPNIKTAYRAKGLFFGARLDGAYQIEPQQAMSLRGEILKLRLSMVEAIDRRLPKISGAVLKAMCLGDNRNMPGEVERAFRMCGVSHLLVVSGLHLTTFGGVLFLLLRRAKLHRKLKALIGVLFTAFFAFLTGGAPSVLRAAVMLGLCYGADLFRREADSLNSVGFALTGMLLLNPFAARSLSLLLSTFATLGILLLAKPMEERCLLYFKKMKHRKILYSLCAFCVSVFSVTASVTIFTLPIQIWSFGTISLLSLPANLLLLTPAGVLMLFGMLGSAFSLLHLVALSNFCLFLAEKLSIYLLFVTEHLSNLPYAVLPVQSSFSKLLLAVFFLVAAVLLLFKKPKKTLLKTVAALTCVSFLLVNFTVLYVTEHTMQLTLCETKHGAAVLLHANGENILILDGVDAYADSEICDILITYGASHLDAVLLPTESRGALSCARRVGEEIPIETVYYADGYKATDLNFSKAAKPIEKTVLTLPQSEMIVAAAQNPNSAYVQILYGEFKGLISCAPKVNFEGDGASLFLTSKELPEGFSPDNFSCLLLSNEDENIENFLSSRSDAVYTADENGSITLTAKKDGTFYLQKRR